MYLREEFLEFVVTTPTTGEALATLFLDKLHEWNLDTSYLCAQGYYGAANMSGSFKGVRARIQEQHPAAVYVHCKAHVLNLALVHSCQEPLVRNMLGTVKEVVRYLKTAKRQHLFRKQLALVSDTVVGKKQKLQELCKTCWNSRAGNV